MNQLIPIPIDDPLPMAWLDTNDLGNAERLQRLAKGELLWVEDLGWAGYDGKRWSTRDGTRMASLLAHDVARHIDREAGALNAIADKPVELEAAFGWAVPPEIAQERVIALRKWAVKSGDASRTAAMITQARTLMTARQEDFDTDPLAFNVQNGTLRFHQKPDKTWFAKLHKHDSTDMIMQIAKFTHDAGAKCPMWMERLELIQPDPDSRNFLQQRYGYFLTGLISEQKWFIDQGRGGDGKSVTNTVMGILMGDYYRHAEIATFLDSGAQKSGSDHSSDLARLQGDIRFVLADEPKERSTWNGGRLKQVTGGKITCRPMHKAEIEYFARWKLVIEVNPLPKVPNDDDGFWRRVHMSMWSYQFDKTGQAAEPWELILERLASEDAGILNWMIAGACTWLQTRRLPVTASSAEAIGSYRQSASPIGDWLDERCDTSDPDARFSATALYADFKAFCEGLQIDPVPSQTAFGNTLRNRQHIVIKDSRGLRVRKGIKLKADGIGGGLGAVAGTGAASKASGVGGRAALPPATYFGDDDDLDDRP